MGCDVCRPLVDSAWSRGHEVQLCDGLRLPYRDGCFDAVLSIAGNPHQRAIPDRLTRGLGWRGTWGFQALTGRFWFQSRVSGRRGVWVEFGFLLIGVVISGFWGFQSGFVDLEVQNGV